MKPEDKFVCECGWCGPQSMLLTAPNPFEPDETLYGCPACKGVDSMFRACDEPECHEVVTCGTPTKGGYKQTCSMHKPFLGQNDRHERRPPALSP